MPVFWHVDTIKLPLSYLIDIKYLSLAYNTIL